MAKKSNKRTSNPTDAQWSFASAYIRTGSKMKAMLEAYPKYADKPLSQQRALANRTINSKGTQQALRELQSDAKASARKTISDHVMQLERLRELSIAEGSYGNAIKAEMGIGKALGFHVERRVNMSVIGSMEEFNAQLAALIEQQPRLGVELQPLLRHQEAEKLEASNLLEKDAQREGVVDHEGPEST